MMKANESRKQIKIIEDQGNNYKKLKEYFKIRENMVNYLHQKQCFDFIQDFELINYIGSGCSGVVYEGMLKKEPSKRVCLKFLLNKIAEEKREKNKNKSPQERISEIYFQNKLKDKNIASYYNYYNIKDYGCIIMEYAKFGDLHYFRKDLIKKKNLSETLIAYLTKQILSALNYIHQSKIIHMDIKEQNILIDHNLNVKITDFSVSISYDKYKTNNNKIKLPLVGTSFYMSPEVLSKAEIDVEDCSKIDMFSLGILLYNLAFQKFPYDLDYNDKRNFEGIYRKIIKSKTLIFPDKKNYSNLFKKFLVGLLEKNIKERYSISDALEDPWIKGANILFKEKDKIYELEKFLIFMITDNVKAFNEYLKNNSSASSETLNTSN